MKELFILLCLTLTINFVLWDQVIAYDQEYIYQDFFGVRFHLGDVYFISKIAFVSLVILYI